MIPCAKNCIHQLEGCCELCGKMKITNPSNECPYYTEISDNKVNSLPNGADIDKLNGRGNFNTH